MQDIKFDFNSGINVKNKKPVVLHDFNSLVQNIKIEALTNEGDLWHNADFGWNLVEFMHRNIDEMLFIEISQRIKQKLSNRKYVDAGSIEVKFEVNDEKLLINVCFKIDETETDFTVILNRINAEVSVIG